MRVISITVGGHYIEDGLAGSVQAKCFRVRRVVTGIFANTNSDYEFPFRGAEIERFDDGHSVGKAAIGAAIGGLLTGGLGALAGAAIGGKKRHSLAVRYPTGDAAVIELDTSELQAVVGRAGAQKSSKRAEVSARFSTSPTFLTVVLVAIVALFVLGAVLGGSKTSDVQDQRGDVAGP